MHTLNPYRVVLVAGGKLSPPTVAPPPPLLAPHPRPWPWYPVEP